MNLKIIKLDLSFTMLKEDKTVIHYHITSILGHDEVIPNTALDYAIVFGMDMFATLSQSCAKLLEDNEGIDYR